MGTTIELPLNAEEMSRLERLAAAQGKSLPDHIAAVLRRASAPTGASFLRDVRSAVERFGPLELTLPPRNDFGRPTELDL